MTDQRGGRRFDGVVVGQSVHFLTMRSPASGRSFAAALNAGGLRPVGLRPHGENATRSDPDVEVIIHRL